MTKTFKLPLAFIALACTLPVAAPALAQDGVLVVSQSALQQWQNDRTKELDRLLQSDRDPFGRPLSGIVQASFTLDEDGRPTGLETVHNSAGVASQRIARWAVSQLRDLDSVPLASADGVRFQANIIFAANERERDAFAAELAAMESARLATAETGRVIAIG